MFRFLLFIIPLIFFINCSQKYVTRGSYLITFKSKDMKFSDMGFIAKDGENIRVTIYSFGKLAFDLEMENLISVNGDIPIPYTLFNLKYLSSDYPAKTIKNIFLGQPIFDKKNLKKEVDGFSQEFNSIIYKVSKNKIFFKDKKNRIFIQIKSIIKSF